jgi:hypothetical protein
VFTPKQPTLRNFAITGAEKRTLFGTIWRVLDRRTSQETQLLFVPNHFKSWPRILATLEHLAPSVVKLRTGQVALLFGQTVTLQDVLAKGKSIPKKVILDPLHGFLPASAHSYKLWLIAPTVALSIAMALTFQTKAPTEVNLQIPVQVQTKQTCIAKPLVGMQISKSDEKIYDLKISDCKFRMQVASNFGGLVQINLKRFCDNKHFAVEAWAQAKYYLISKVN